MKDRFYGFRYELHTRSSADDQLLLKVQQEADSFSCFGWTQLSPSGTVVGEARCSKARGPVLVDRLKALAEVTRVDVLVGAVASGCGCWL
jgi:hypothetical protein